MNIRAKFHEKIRSLGPSKVVFLLQPKKGSLSTKLEKTLQTYIGEGMCAPGVGQILGQRLDKKKFEGCGHDKANVGL